jgi:hypothetical protein
MHTPFPALDAVLSDLGQAVRAILGSSYVGCYLQGSFALGAGDLESDADFLVVVTEPPSGTAEARLRQLHGEIPTRPGVWNRNLEGSYADQVSLRTTAGLGVPWLFSDRGHRELVWDDHCNNLHTRWILRNRGIVLDGPPLTDLVDDVPAQAMREAARAALPGMVDGIRAWADMEHAWTPRYIVQTCSRALFTTVTGEVASKAAAVEWARAILDPAWLPLLTQVAAERGTPWRPVDPPPPGRMEQALAFAAHVEVVAGQIPA